MNSLDKSNWKPSRPNKWPDCPNLEPSRPQLARNSFRSILLNYWQDCPQSPVLKFAQKPLQDPQGHLFQIFFTRLLTFENLWMMTNLSTRLELFRPELVINSFISILSRWLLTVKVSPAFKAFTVTVPLVLPHHLRTFYWKLFKT